MKISEICILLFGCILILVVVQNNGQLNTYNYCFRISQIKVCLPVLSGFLDIFFKPEDQNLLSLMECRELYAEDETEAVVPDAAPEVVLPALPDECNDYKILNEASRSTDNAVPDGPYLCDLASGPTFKPNQGDVTMADWQGEAWYRVQEPAGSRIPTLSPGTHHCGTQSSTWMNGLHPNTRGDSKEVDFCLHWDQGPCHKPNSWTRNGKVTNCGDYFVYMLPDMPGCSGVYCTVH